MSDTLSQQNNPGTSLEQTELAALRAELAFYRAAFRTLPDSAVFIYDRDMHCIAAGGQALANFDSLPERTPDDSIPHHIPKPLTEHTPALQAAALQGEMTHLTLDIDEQVFGTQIMPLRDEANAIIGAMVLSQDKTTNVRKHTRLELLETIIAQSPYGITVTDTERRISITNQANAQMLGYETSDDLLGAQGFNYVAPEDMTRVLNEISPSILQKGTWRGRLRARRIDGSTVWTDQSMQVLTNSAGQALGIVTYAKDITHEVEADVERENLLTQLAGHERDLRIFKELVERAPDGIAFGGNYDFSINYANHAFGTMTGLGNNIQGASFTSIYSPEVIASVQQEISPAINRDNFWAGQLSAVRPDGSTWITQVTCYLIKDPNDGVTRWVAFYRDVTEQVHMAKEHAGLQEQVIRAQEATLRELSTPLIPITEKVVAMPLVGSIDSRRAQMVMESLLEGVSRIQAHVVILDITGVPIVDTQVANALLHVTQALKLLGARVLLTGIRPEVAQTLVSLGTDLSMIEIRRDLRSAISTVLD